MKKNEVKLGETYEVKVSGYLVPVRILRENSFGGWDGLNLITNREVRIKTGARVRGVY